MEHGLENGVAQGNDLGLGQGLAVRTDRGARLFGVAITRGFFSTGRSISGSPVVDPLHVAVGEHHVADGVQVPSAMRG